MKPVVIVARGKAEHNPDRNRLIIQFLFPEQNGGRGGAGEIILINKGVPQIKVKAPEAVLVETEYREDRGRERNKQSQKTEPRIGKGRSESSS